ncbi:MAG TPA: hypothetical protein VMN82_07595 [Thermoanaerobaculia bacterium]|nr:hypothetical protein [Thermoanaerobaculia bacterium]
MSDDGGLCSCGLAILEPEGSVPLSGFSRELRGAPDVQRFRFPFPLRGDAVLPVHLVYSAARRTAEVKAVDLKVYRVEDVTSPCDAQARWVAWWRTSRPASARGFLAPRRVGRFPRPMPRFIAP